VGVIPPGALRGPLREARFAGKMTKLKET
jgi:hypothetical protein